jgi:hypothetical protein
MNVTGIRDFKGLSHRLVPAVNESIKQAGCKGEKVLQDAKLNEEGDRLLVIARMTESR